MANSNLLSLAPAFLRKRLMIVETAIESSVISFARQLEPGKNVLDAGCGEARFARHFTHCRYVGVDLAVGDGSWDYSRLDARADLSALSFSNDSFDAVLGIVVLEHTVDPNRVLREIFRVLKPGGKLLLAVPHQWEVHQAPHDYYRYTCFGMKWMLAKAGFQENFVQPIGGFFTLLARRLLNSVQFFMTGLRWCFFPFVAVIAGPWALVLPFFDFLDHEKNFTLAYLCLVEKPASA